jgi:ribosomal protein S18 acetylase RimI-like enzyme
MNSEAFVIRRGRDSDWTNVGQAVVEIQETERALVGYPLRPAKDGCHAYVRQLRNDIDAHQGVLLIAEANDGIVGVLTGYVDSGGDPLVAAEFDRSAYISDLFVHPQWRRKGVATSLMREFEKIMRRTGLEWATVCVKSKNVEARSAYQVCDYEEYEIVYAKKLSPPDEGGD